MILTGRAILEARRNGSITIEPFDERNLNPNSYNFHLQDTILVKSARSGRWKRRRLTHRGVVLTPGTMYLGATMEVIGSVDHVMTLLGISSMGRLGVFLNITADLGHLGARSRWTLEIVVVQRVRIYPGMPIGQVAFWRVMGARRQQYSGRYLNHLEPEPNRDRALLGPRR
jgi:dCTP deaminase